LGTKRLRQTAKADLSTMQADAFQMSPDHWHALGKAGDKHKYEYGYGVVVSGPAGQGGAARLAARGTLRIGAGFITGLLARGFGSFDAAACGAELHFRCAAKFGPGLIAEDIPEMLPHVLR
jgi:NAD(P)H-hydrate repair Nnr-like enzyme with NAD(P)H-hydrate dehydratase domain